MGLVIYDLGDLIIVEGIGGGLVFYEGYVSVKLEMFELNNYVEDILMFVILDSRYGKRVFI